MPSSNPPIHHPSGSRLLRRQGPPRQSPPPTPTTSSLLTSSSSSATQSSLSSFLSSGSSSATAIISSSSSSIPSSEIFNSTTTSSFSETSFLPSATSTTSAISSSFTASSSVHTSSSISSTPSSSRSTHPSTTRIPSSVLKTPSTTSHTIPATTLILTGDILDSSTITRTVTYDPSSIVTSSPISAAASSNGFWDNKGAVGGTFTVVGLVVLGIFVAVVIILRRHITERQAQLHQGLFDNYGERESSRGHGDSPEPSINAVPMDAFQTRQFYSDYGYPASSDPFGGNDSYISNVSPNTSNANFSVRQTEAVPPVSSRSPADRVSSGYQQSIDSFYGVASQPHV